MCGVCFVVARRTRHASWALVAVVHACALPICSCVLALAYFPDSSNRTICSMESAGSRLGLGLATAAGGSLAEASTGTVLTTGLAQATSQIGRAGCRERVGQVE